MVLAEQILEIELVIIQTSRKKNSGLGVLENHTIYTVSFQEGWKIQVQSHRQSLLRPMGSAGKLPGSWVAAGQWALLQGEVIFPEVFAAIQCFHIVR